jgi:mannose-6-phosphate isomerase-like protein (cupin superfamily)
MAASDKVWVVLTIYAADGENGLHPHPNEDHTFVVRQGEAKFYGPNHEIRTIGKNEGAVRFIGSKRRATNTGDGAYRGCCVRRGRPSRPINPDGSEMRVDSVENKPVELIISDRWFR